MGSKEGGRSGRRALGVVLAVVVAVAAACTGSPPAATPPAARLQVVAGLWPLAEVARVVGGTRVTVTDLTPVATEPRDLDLTPAGATAIGGAAVVIDVGGGFQPAVERAAARAPAVVSALGVAGGADPYVWLDPVLLQAVVARVAAAFERADPSGTAVYRQGARDFTAELIALDISFRSSLADCARHDIVTSYPMFGRLAARYGLTDHAVSDLPPAAGPRPGPPAGLAQLIKAKGLSTLFDDPLTPSATAGALARQSHLKVEPLDPIAGLTGPQQARHATYLSRMADDLAALRSALACDTSD